MIKDFLLNIVLPLSKIIKGAILDQVSQQRRRCSAWCGAKDGWQDLQGNILNGFMRQHVQYWPILKFCHAFFCQINF